MIGMRPPLHAKYLANNEWQAFFSQTWGADDPLNPPLVEPWFIC
jgi:hypothetical protein